METTAKVKELMRQHDFLKRQRRNWEAQYKDISDYMLPRKGFFFEKEPNLGDTRNTKIIDSLPIRAMRILTAGLQGGLTSPSRPWFRLRLENKEWGEHPLVKIWLARVEEHLRDALAQSNFYQAAHSMYSELSGFGTGVMLVERGKKKKLNFRVLTVGEYCIATDDDGMVDTIYREFYLTAKQCKERFGDQISTDIKKKYENTPYEFVKVCHVVKPNTGRKSGKIDKYNKKWESIYYEAGGQNKLLSQGGYEKFQFACPRWDVNGNDTYGRSPGMDVLPDVKTLQVQSKSITKAILKAVDPPLKASSGLKGRVNLYPGAVTHVDDGVLEEIIKTRPDIQAAILAREDTRNAIREGLYNDLFLLLTQPQRDVTATEIMERKEEKMLMLGPVVERQHTEFADVIIELSLDILMDDPDFPALPPEIMELIGDYKIEYVSVLAQAQKLVGTQAIVKSAEFAGNLAQGFPEILDRVNPDEMLKDFHDMVGAPADQLNPDEVVDGKRKARAEDQKKKEAISEAMIQQQMQAQQVQTESTAIKTAGEALRGASEVDVDQLLQNLRGGANG